MNILENYHNHQIAWESFVKDLEKILYESVSQYISIFDIETLITKNSADYRLDFNICFKGRSDIVQVIYKIRLNKNINEFYIVDVKTILPNNQTEYDIESFIDISINKTQWIKDIVGAFNHNLNRLGNIKQIYNVFLKERRELSEEINENNKKIWKYKKGDLVKVYNTLTKKYYNKKLNRKFPSKNIIEFDDGDQIGFHGTNNIILN